MSNYFDAYRARLERNQADLLNLANEVKKLLPEIEVYVNRDYPNRLLSSITFIHGETINTIAFHDVPYRWAGCGFREWSYSHSGGENSSMPFTAVEVLQTMQPITKVKKRQNEFFKSKSNLLSWWSFLTPLSF